MRKALEFAHKFKELRLEHHYTQKEVANLLGVKPTTVSAWELGNNTPRLDMVEKISDLFDTDIDYFVNHKSKSKNKIDLTNDDVIFTYEGRQIPKEDLAIIKRLMRGGKE